MPSALVERVETITGGASAVYGADAIGGVTNFILRNNFEGFEVDAQYGVMDANDGDEYRVSAILGGNFGDGRGNVVLGLENYTRHAAYARNRDFQRDYWQRTDTAGSFFFLQGVNSAGFISPNWPSKDSLNAIYGGQNPLAWFQAFAPDIPNMNFNSDGTVFVSGNAVGESRAKIPVDGLSYAKQRVNNNQDSSNSTQNEVLKWNNTQAFTSAPQERWSFFANGNFDITDEVSAFARVNFAESETETLLFGTNAIGGWEACRRAAPSTPTKCGRWSSASTWNCRCVTGPPRSTTRTDSPPPTTTQRATSRWRATVPWSTTRTTAAMHPVPATSST